MLGALRSLSLHFSSSPASLYHQSWKLGSSGSYRSFISSLVEFNSNTKSLLDLNEVEKVLTDVRADDVKVIPVGDRCAWTDYMVIATGRSTWHVKNIAQALYYKAKDKQRGAERMMLPSVQGQEGGKWIVIDSGKVIVHALDENARAYYDLENLWNSKSSADESTQDLEKAFMKTRPKNNSKRPAGKNNSKRPAARRT
ncbi:protein Iojap-related, mitochondrial [Euphorbia lathyris]|uniref:protein Iojap-related, mitochondrial n=1 Tax=Euphorbia lathyris TaxID=212925 RepID=UPI0033133E13